MLNTMHNHLTDLLASARAVILAGVSSLASVLDSMQVSTPMRGQRPAMAVLPVSASRRRPMSRISQVSPASCVRGYDAIAGFTANAAVRMHADPVTEGWRSLDFGKTKTGNTGHSQPSRFAT